MIFFTPSLHVSTHSSQKNAQWHSLTIPQGTPQIRDEHHHRFMTWDAIVTVMI